MSQTKDGGPAFPSTWVETNDGAEFSYVIMGMTLRDWFAGQALAGLNANASFDDTFQPKNFEFTAKTAYMQADALIAFRNQEGI